ncbi:MAG TPA: hypothetical protein VII55_02800 [Candidatus Saccharimonadales bacterium]
MGGILIITPAVAGAATLISQGFLTTGSLPAGTIVSLRKDSSDYVDSTTSATANNILGVTISNESSQVSVSSGQNNQVQVATNGVEQVLVSDIDGNIAVGDPITASPISGVGMKAIGNAKVVGIAQDSFPNSTSSRQSYTNKNGQQHPVTLGTVPVLVNVAYYYKQPDKTLIPPALQNIANALAGKTVNSLPILISIGVFIVTLIIVVSIIYSMIHSSIISVGRNPMAQAAVYRNVIQLSGLVVIILGVAIAVIYMVLTRL